MQPEILLQKKKIRNNPKTLKSSLFWVEGIFVVTNMLPISRNSTCNTARRGAEDR